MLESRLTIPKFSGYHCSMLVKECWIMFRRWRNDGCLISSTFNKLYILYRHIRIWRWEIIIMIKWATKLYQCTGWTKKDVTSETTAHVSYKFIVPAPVTLFFSNWFYTQHFGIDCFHYFEKRSFRFKTTNKKRSGRF